MILEPGNIWSGSKTLAAFTNPTELAFKKGNLKKHYPVVVNKIKYPDAEQAYQVLKHKTNNRIMLMSLILNAKLKQHPELIQDIEDSGGDYFLKNCDHIVYNNSDWEGKGVESLFIRVLMNVYNNIGM